LLESQKVTYVELSRSDQRRTRNTEKVIGRYESLTVDWLKYNDQWAKPKSYLSSTLDSGYLNSFLSEKKATLAYRIRGAGLFSEVLSIVDSIAFAAIHNLGFALIRPDNEVSRSASYRRALFDLFSSLSPVDISPGSPNSLVEISSQYIYDWRLRSSTCAFQIHNMTAVPLFFIRSAIISSLFPFSSLVRYVASNKLHDTKQNENAASIFLRFGDKLKTESIDIHPESISGALAIQSKLADIGSLDILSDNNAKSHGISEALARLNPCLISRSIYLHKREHSYSNELFASSEDSYLTGFQNAIFNMLYLSKSSSFYGDPFCNLVAAASLYRPNSYRPSCLYPTLPC
jgi:hypothetical protein